ncbi:MAG TPA: MotA/TolQ/ExbB proton channel family protein [Bryobacteraceae bacterium]|nr:MotA/TolQ/ExbB proton channel family protein [Bryobacteraceae bacterium]
MTPGACYAFFIQISILDLVKGGNPVTKVVLAILLIFSVLSWAIIYAKWNVFRKARAENMRFLRSFRKATGLEAVATVARQAPEAPLAAMFQFGFEEVERQVKSRGTLNNKLALERSLQLGISEEVAMLERNMNWLATVASISPFIGLFGTVLGIIDAFHALALAGSASLRAVAPGISEALVATAMGLAAAIPAAIFYNHFGYVIRELGTRMDDFSLEFMNLAERTFED